MLKQSTAPVCAAPAQRTMNGPTAWRGVLLDAASLDTGDLDFTGLDAVCPQWTRYPATRPEQLAARISDADVVVTNKVVVGAPALDAAPRVRLICIAATGTDNVDLSAAQARGVAVTNVTGYATAAVVQHVAAMMLSWATRLAEQRRAVRDGDWSASEHFCLLRHPVRELAGKRLGIVGYGTLGRGVARVAAALGMEVLVAQRPGGPWRPGRLTLQELLPQVQVLTLHCPLADNTRGLIGAGELARMRADALLINTARGAVVDEEALAAALRAGRPGAAAVDTLSVEPPPADHPLLAPDLTNLILTPHVAWASVEARQRLLEEVAANISAFAAGERRNRVI